MMTSMQSNNSNNLSSGLHKKNKTQNDISSKEMTYNLNKSGYFPGFNTYRKQEDDITQNASLTSIKSLSALIQPKLQEFQDDSSSNADSKHNQSDYDEDKNNNEAIYNDDLSRVCVAPRGYDSDLIDGIIIIKTGSYQGGKFKFLIQLAMDSRSKMPSVIFKTKIFHPLIDQKTGKLDMKFLDSKWYSKGSKLSNLIAWIKDIFHEIEYLSRKDSYNSDAGRLFEDNFNAFDEKVRKSIDESNRRLYQNTAAESLKFYEFNTIHKKIIDNLRNIMRDNNIQTKDKSKAFLKYILSSK